MCTYAEIAVGSFINDIENDMNIYDYIIPERYKDALEIGMKVVVPFGGRLLEGYVIKVKDVSPVPSNKLKEIIDIPEKEPVFSSKEIILAKWMSEEYICSLTDSLKCIIPPETVMKESKLVRLAGPVHDALDSFSPMEKKIISELNNGEQDITTSRLCSLYGKGTQRVLKRMADCGYIIIESRMTKGVKDKTAKGIKVNCCLDELEDIILQLESKKNTVAQAKILKILKTAGEPVIEKDFAKSYNVSQGTVNTLVKKGILEHVEIDVVRDPYKDTVFPKVDKPQLTDDQKKVVYNILNGFYNMKKGKFLIHGVTGCGKTEVYMSLVEHIIKDGKRAIMLVPEISLTPQTIERFKGRFERVAVLHSRLSKGERYDEWKRIRNNEVDVVVGARSAVFAPVNNLGIIVIDEEHEYSYKSDKTPKYHAREVAEKRCEIDSALLVLGSATPCLETFHQAKMGFYNICTMDKRVDNRLLPVLQIADMRQEITSGNRTIFSRLLYKEMREALKNGHQIILFLNRRGFSTFVSCRKCGHVMKCPRCDVSLTYHADKNSLNCHYCDLVIKPPDTCPKCGSNYIKYFGLGTQKVESEVKRLFPSSRVLRMDFDTTSNKGAHERIYRDFKDNRADILVGTQMISKGLDFPNVTLVGIIAADLTLNIPDYKACERTFQLITQVSGRAGRGEYPGRVIVQTYNPEHYSIVSALHQDYTGFFNREIIVRKDFQYPPFCDLVNIVASAKEENKAIYAIRDIACKIAETAREEKYDISILGPTPAPISKIKMSYRWQTIIKGSVNMALKRFIMEYALMMRKKNKDVNLNIDINPVSLI